MPDAETWRENDDPVISIGVLSERVGLSVSAVRKYENEGLIIAHRTDSGRRLFSHADIGRIRKIQHLIQDLGFNIEGIRRMQALLPCWDLHPCSPQTREACPAYQETKRPCWTIKGLNCAPQGNECRRCVVYRLGSLCTEQTKRLLHDHDDSHNSGAEIRELVQRLKTPKQED